MNSKLRDILNGIADIGRGWVHDQLDGTSFIKDALDGIDKEVAEAEKAIRQAVAEEMLEFIGSDETLMEQSEYDKIDVPHKETNRSVRGEMLYTVRQATRNDYRAELRQKIKQWSKEPSNEA